MSAGHLLQGEPTFVAATPAGIMEILRAYEIPLEGARAVVVGRSNIVGKPMSLLLLAENATVTMCHSRTRDLPQVVREADVVVAAVGRAGDGHARDGQARAPRSSTSASTASTARSSATSPRTSARSPGHLTPVPGGVGPMTIASLLRNTVRAARYQAEAACLPGRLKLRCIRAAKMR